MAVAAKIKVVSKSVGQPSREPPRLLIEEWLSAAAIGVECMRERGSASALALHTKYNVNPCLRRGSILALRCFLSPKDLRHRAMKQT